MGIPNYRKDIGTEWQKTQRKIRNNFTSANSSTGSTVIATDFLQITGQLTIAAGGKFVASYTNGQQALYIGPINVDGVSGEGIVIKRADGTEALRVEGLSSLDGSWSLKDVDQNTVVTDDSSGLGLGRPYIPVTLGSVVGTLPGNTSGSYVTVWKGIFQKQQSNLRLHYHYDVSATTGDILVQATGADTFSTTTLDEQLGLSSTGDVSMTLAIPGDYLEEVTIEIQTRVASGTGSTGVSVLGSYGIES